MFLNNHTKSPTSKHSTNLMLCSLASQGSISNFIAQTPKENSSSTQFASNMFSKPPLLSKLQSNSKRITNYQNSQNAYPEQRKSMNRGQQSKENISIESNKNANRDRLAFNQHVNTDCGSAFRKLKLPYKMVNSELPSCCINHEDRKSSFFVEQTSVNNNGQTCRTFYCEKCAILIASQGFRVQRIEESLDEKSYQERKTMQSNFAKGNSSLWTEKSDRLSLRQVSNGTVKKAESYQRVEKQRKQSELTGFLNLIERTQTKLQKIEVEKENCHKETVCIYDKQKEQLEQAYSQIQQRISAHHSCAVEAITKKLQEELKFIEELLEDLANSLNTLENMREDICESYDDIISMTTSEEFRTVMEAYQLNIQNMASEHFERRVSGGQSGSVPSKKNLTIEIDSMNSHSPFSQVELKDSNLNHNSKPSELLVFQKSNAVITVSSLWTTLVSDISKQLGEVRRDSLLNERRHPKRPSSMVRERRTASYSNILNRN